MNRFLFLATLAIFPLAMAGCGLAAGSATYPVSGTVSFDGQAVPDGDIFFVSVPGPGENSGKIVGGKFSFRATPGKKKVRIQTSKITEGGRKGAMGEPVADDYIPDRYNKDTTLTAEVVSGGKNEFTFTLSSK